jgi:hypothetical protein
MRIPEFTAEVTLKATSERYRMAETFAASAPANDTRTVRPQMPFIDCYRYWRARGFSRLTSVINCL